MTTNEQLIGRADVNDLQSILSISNRDLDEVVHAVKDSADAIFTWDYDKGKRAVGFKLSDGMEVPDELESRFKFARQKSKLAGTIRGSYFAFKNDY